RSFTARPIRTQIRGLGECPAGQFPRHAAGQHSDLRASAADYLWACRQEFRPEDLISIQTEVTAQISRVLHMLVVHEPSRRTSITSDTELGVTECLARANAALKGEFRPDLSAEAQKWFLSALLATRAMSRHSSVWRLRASISPAVRGGVMRVPPRRHPTLAARQLRWPSNSRRGMPQRNASRGCCFLRQAG